MSFFHFFNNSAHCTYGNKATNFKVRAGSSFYREGGITIQVEKIIQHENFNYYDIDFDFSVLKLSESLEYTENIKQIALPEQDEEVEDDTLCFVSGWGTTHSSNQSREKLRAAYVPSVNQEFCTEAYKNFGPITDQMICAGFKRGQVDACQGQKIKVLTTLILTIFFLINRRLRWPIGRSWKTDRSCLMGK